MCLCRLCATRYHKDPPTSVLQSQTAELYDHQVDEITATYEKRTLQKWMINVDLVLVSRGNIAQSLIILYHCFISTDVPCIDSITSK